MDIRGLFFLDANHGWAVGDDAAAGQTALILHTSDGGINWVSQQSSGLSGTNELYGVDFINPLEGWAVSVQGGDIIHSTDGGLNWNKQFEVGPGALHVVDFVDSNTGWAGGRVRPGGVLILHTTTGGTAAAAGPTILTVGRPIP